MNKHFIIRCDKCAVIVSQCRCPDFSKQVIYQTCDVCKFEEQEKEKEIVRQKY